ncbi:hypothetical protein [Kutzneria chonburiensis]|uniref:Tail assembly chaperone n=1 Tax=Kutzneria chonburiensis TaxID=1483604 RepID=A0ABV6N376_9PSEU|nr:hypothetical protein [Kutzneria chonburiensis]
MSKPNKSRLRIETLRKTLIEASPEIEFSVGGEDFSLPSVELWPDEALELMPSGEGQPDVRSIVAIARIVLGADYERFKRAGGRAMDLFLVIGAVAEDQGVTPGE